MGDVLLLPKADAGIDKQRKLTGADARESERWSFGRGWKTTAVTITATRTTTKH